jgi:hypothetical protein
MSKIYFDEKTDRRIEFDRLLCNSRKKEGDRIFTEGDFQHYIFMLGLMDYESRILPKQTGKPYKPYYFIQGEEVICRSEPVEEAV